MNLSSEIKQRILTDNQFSLNLALRLDMKQDYIMKLARREDTAPTLMVYPAIKFYEENGYDESHFDSKANTEA